MRRAAATAARALIAATLAFLVAIPVAAQIPERFTNLQLPDAEVSRPELIELMRSFSFALGVRCSNCHAVSDGLDDPSDDFASDAKPAKDTARAMLRMVGAINGEFLAGLPARSEASVSVTCMTCHRGVRRPELLETLLFRVADRRRDRCGAGSLRRAARALLRARRLRLRPAHSLFTR